MAEIIDGKKIAAEIKKELKKEVISLKDRGIVPGLTAILVGDNPASEIYVRLKRKAADEVGIFSLTENLDKNISEAALLDIIHTLNNNPRIHGILVQMPLPGHIDDKKILNAVSPIKDVDGFHPVNVGKLVVGEEDVFFPCTPAGIQEMLMRSGYDPTGLHTVVVGRSNIVGKPIANILLQKKKGANSTVTICHTGTADMAYFTKQADILIVAAGAPEVIHGSMIKEGAAVIDVGMNRINDPRREKGYKLVGDVHFESAMKVAGAISPVPGGVGPMTITMLLKNTVLSAKRIVEERK